MTGASHLLGYCRKDAIQFTRGRPYKKDDNAHIEQKNWTHVRKLMGYVRYDTEAAVAAMNAVYADLRLLQNLFMPSVKLLRKERVGARVRRRYDRPQTPLDRLETCPGADPGRMAALRRQRADLDPFELAQRVDEGGPRLPAGQPRPGCFGAGGASAGHRPAGRHGAQINPVVGNRTYGATKRRWVTLTYGSTGPLRSSPTWSADQATLDECPP